MKNLFYIICISLFALTSCQIDEIDVFGEDRHIHFLPIDEEYSLRYNFLYSGGKDEVEIKIPLRYFGRMLDADTAFDIEVVKDSTTAVKAEYKLPSEKLFKGGVYNDTLLLTLKNSYELTLVEKRLFIRLVSNDSFQANVKGAIDFDIYFSNIIAKPQWWDEEVESAYLGEYGEIKLSLFIDNIYSGDYGSLSADEKLYYARLFKYWLKDNPSYEHGQLITVPVIG